MPENPFPGMNPYLEQRWGDVHARLVAYAADMIQEKLPADLRARMQERVFVESEGTPLRAISPDVHVHSARRPAVGSEEAAGGVAVATEPVAEPIMIYLPPVEIRETFLEIIDARSRGRVVSVIEFVSLANKVGWKGRRLYRQKQAEAKSARVNLVEIDLLRVGKSVTLSRPKWVPLPSLPPTMPASGARPNLSNWNTTAFLSRSGCREFQCRCAQPTPTGNSTCRNW